MAKNFIKNYNKYLFLIPLLVFCGLAFCVFNDVFVIVDTYVYTTISQYQNDFVTTFLQIITIMGTGGWMILLGILVFFKNRQIAKTLVIHLLISDILKEALKYIFMRDRPSMMQLIDINGYSFPSGHATLSFVFYGLCIYFLWQSSFRYKKVYSFLLLLLILIIGYSRIYLGVHYFSDVLAGYLLGSSYLLYVINKSRRKT